MIEQNQKESLIEVLELFAELGLTKHVVLKVIFDRVCRLNSIDLSFLNNKNEQVIL